MAYNNSEICEKAIEIIQNYIRTSDENIVEDMIDNANTKDGHLFDDRKFN
jgi:translation initiation factor 2B subunit (eIF-2B alpha/beta/delta family)